MSPTAVVERPFFAGTIRAAAEGEVWARDALASLCVPQLTAFAESRGASDPGGIADLAMVEFLNRLDGLTFDTPGQMWAYLYRIARSRVIDERRASKPVELHDRGTLEQLVPPHDGLDEEVADRIDVNLLLAGLTDEQREILELRFLHDLSIEETATRTGRTLTAVKGLQRRAIRSLSALILAAAVLIVGFLLLRSGDGGVTTVSDGPASEGVGGDAGLDGDGTDGSEQGLGVLSVTGAEVGPPTVETSETFENTTVGVAITGSELVEDDPRSMSITFEAIGSDPPDGFGCRLDTGPEEACTSPWVTTDLDPGNHILVVRVLGGAMGENVDGDASGSPNAYLVWSIESDEDDVEAVEARIGEAVSVAGPTRFGIDLDPLRASGEELRCGRIGGTVEELEAKGYDVTVGTDGDDLLDVSAGSRPDFVIANDGNDTIITGEGDDVVCGGNGNDTISTGPGADRILGHGGNDTIEAGGGKDKVWAGGGNDSVSGGDGEDHLAGEAGFDVLEGGKDDDTLEGGADETADAVDGGPGEDTCGTDDPSTACEVDGGA